MSYTFKLPLVASLNGHMSPYYLEKRMIDWLTAIDDQLEYGFEIYSIDYLDGPCVELIPRDDPGWQEIWVDKLEGVWEKRRIITTPTWRWVEQYHIRLRNGGLPSLMSTATIHKTSFEIFDDAVAVQFRMIFEITPDA
jgi:predicted MPP superfamily phosphohydrolase